MSSAPRISTEADVPGTPMQGECVWTSTEAPAGRSWIHALTDEMCEELHSVSSRALLDGVDAKSIRAKDFPLPKTAPLLATVHRELEIGRGYAMLSQFPVDGWSEEQLRIAYCGLCAHLGDITIQNRDEEYILEVMDKGKAYDNQSRGYHSTAHLDFHNDGTNTVTLLCAQTAPQGGQSMLVSGPAVYNAILDEAPEYLDVLHRGFFHHRRDQRLAHEAPVTHYRTPVFGFFNGLFHIAFTAPSILFCEAEGVTLTDHEKAAVAFMTSVIERPGMAISMALRKGDIQFVNNFVCLHARTAYQDSESQRRRLLRLWLDDKASRRLGPGKMDWYMPEHSRFTLSGAIETLQT